MKEMRPLPLFPTPDGEQSDRANDIQDKDNNRVDAKVKELAFVFDVKEIVMCQRR